MENLFLFQSLSLQQFIIPHLIQIMVVMGMDQDKILTMFIVIGQD